jgi:iron complex outermembrane receptor protein
MNRSDLARRIHVICTLALGAAAAPAFGAEVLDTVVVEGDRINVLPTEKLESVFGFGKTAVETPRSVTSISSEMLTKIVITEIDDLVAMTPGSFTQSFFGVAGSLDVRGTPGENYFRGIKRIDNPGNYPTAIGASDRIDIVRGPASPIYGPSKIGGYLNFVPKSARATSGQFMKESQGEMGLTSGSFDKKILHAEVGGPTELAGKPVGYYLYGEFENSGGYYDNTSTDQSIYQASFDMNLSDTSRLEFGGMYQDFKGNQVAGWNRLTQDLIDHGTYITGSPPSLDTNGDGLLSATESAAGNIGAFIIPAFMSPAEIQAAIQAHPNMALVNPGTAHINGSTVLVQDDDTLEDQVLTLYFDWIYDLNDSIRLTNKLYHESLDNLNQNAYGFSQFADTWVVEDQFILAYSTPQMDFWQANFQVSPAIRHQDFEHGDNFAFEYFDRRDITRPGTPIDRRTMATRGQEPFSAHTRGNFTDSSLAFIADITVFDKLNLIAGGRVDHLDMKSELLADTAGGAVPRVSDDEDPASWSASLSYALPFGIRPYATLSKQSTLITGQGGEIPTAALASGDAIGDSELTEFGIKASLLDDHLYLAVDHFKQSRIDYSAQDQVTNNGTTARGYELEARWVVNPVLTLTGAYTNIEIINAGDLSNAITTGGDTLPFSFAGAGDIKGVNPALAFGGVLPSLVAPSTSDEQLWRKAGIPENIYSVYALFSLTGPLEGLTGSIGGTHVDSVFSGFSKVIKLPAYTLVNASVYYETRSWKVGLQGKNLLDERYFRSNFPDLFGSTVVLPELPRSYLVSAAYKF